MNCNVLNTAFPIQYYSMSFTGILVKEMFLQIVSYNSYCFHIHKILSILNVLSIYVNDRKFDVENVHRGHTNEQIL